MKYKKVLQYVQDYGYTVTKNNTVDHISYHCSNPLSAHSFILIILEEGLEIPKNTEQFLTVSYESNLPFVYLIQVDDNMDAVIDFAKAAHNHNQPCLIYDPDDEIEFFLKDLWNTIVDLTKD